MGKRHLSGPLSERARGLACRLLTTLRAEHVGPKVVARDGAASDQLNGPAVMCGNGTAPGKPLRYKGGMNTESASQCALAATLLDGVLDGLLGHATDDSDAIV